MSLANTVNSFAHLLQPLCRGIQHRKLPLFPDQVGYPDANKAHWLMLLSQSPFQQLKPNLKDDLVRAACPFQGVASGDGIEISIPEL